MPKIHQNLGAAQSAEKLYSVIADFVRYPEFLSWCTSASIVNKSGSTIEVEMVISSGPVTKSFTTSNKLKKNSMLHMKLEKGPFSKLEATWEITSTARNECNIEFNMEYEFSNLLTRKLVGPTFSRLAQALTQAFIDRAEQL